MRIHNRQLSRLAWILWLGVAALLTGHVIFFNGLRHVGVSIIVLTALVLLTLVKHFGVLGALYSLFRRRSRR